MLCFLLQGLFPSSWQVHQNNKIHCDKTLSKNIFMQVAGSDLQQVKVTTTIAKQVSTSTKWMDTCVYTGNLL